MEKVYFDFIAPLGFRHRIMTKENMEYSQNKKSYNMEYAKKNLKRIPLDVQLSKYEEIKAAASAAGVPVNTYIKQAIDERMAREASAGPEN